MAEFSIKFTSMNGRKEEPSKPELIMFHFKEKRSHSTITMLAKFNS